MNTTTPSTPAPTLTALVFSLLRSALLIASTAGFYHGATVDDGTLTLIASALVVLGTTAWALVDKFRVARASHVDNIASADAGVPVTVVKESPI